MSRMPQVTVKDLVRFLKAQGFVEDRQAGSHLTLWNEARRIAVTVPIHPGDLGRGFVAKVLKGAGFTTEEFQRLR